MNGLVAQAFATTLATLAVTSGGMMLGWSSPSLPRLLAKDSDLPLTSDQSSWVVSLLFFGNMFGSIFIVFLTDRIGRKWSIYLGTLPLLVSWVVIALASNYKWLYVARFIGGIGYEIVYATAPMYIGEIAEDKIRGGLGVLITTMMNIGLLISFSTGPWVSRQMLSLISAIPPLLLILTFFWMPETPYYLLTKGDREAAESSLMWLRRRKDVKEELETMEHNIKLKQQNKTSVFEIIKTRGNRKALLIGTGLLSIQIWCGLIVISMYASNIFEKSGFSLSSSVCVILMGVVKVAAGFFTVFIADAAGRRPLLIGSSIGIGLCNLVVAVYYNLQALKYDLSDVAWVPFICVVIMYVAYVLGIGSVPSAMACELFPMNAKASAVTLLSIYGAVNGTMVSKLYQIVADAVGIHVVFYAFTAINAMGLVFIVLCVPETKGRSLQDIQNQLNSRTSPKDNVASEAQKTFLS